MWWHRLLDAVFSGDPNWRWRRRITISTALVMHAGLIYSFFFDPDLAHATMVTSNCITGVIAVLTIYVGGGVTDDHLRRLNQRLDEHIARTDEQQTVRDDNAAAGTNLDRWGNPAPQLDH